MAALRFHLLLGAVLIAAAGCANQPARTDSGIAAASPATAPATASTTSAATAASFQAMKSSVPPSLLVFAHDQGYTHVVIKGNQYSFCKTEDEIGELIPTRQCLDQTQLESLRVRVQQQQQDLTRRPTETTTVH